jgi:hypothetical protein
VEEKTHFIKSSMNIMTFGILATVASALIVSLMQYYQTLEVSQTSNNYVDGIVLYALAAVCEAVAEKYMVG